MRRAWIAAAAIAVAVVDAGTAFAAGDEAAAEALFVEAKKLAAQKKYAEACPKFAESNRLDRGAGTMIHLGDCYEKNHQLASAWATYKEAASAAQALGRKDWEKLATQRASTLEPKLAHLTIKVEAPVEKMTVTRDGTEVSSASWGVSIPVDAGEHTVRASAPGHREAAISSTVAKDGQAVEIVVPKLVAEPTVAAPPPVAPVVLGPANAPAPPDRAASSSSTQRTVGFVVGGVGVAGLAVGAVTGLMAIGKKNDATDVCPNDGACASQGAVDAADGARTLGTVSTIGFIAGGALLVGGAALVLTAPKAPRRTGVRLLPTAGRTGAGLDIAGVF